MSGHKNTRREKRKKERIVCMGIHVENFNGRT
jgi:hypothetical protein